VSVVLIVEDQAVVARLLVTWVEAEGASPMLATSAEQALLLASERTPAVALCDVNLPGGRDGFWLAEQLRSLHPETAVVMATGLHQFDHAVAGLRAGVVDYVTKPVTRERLMQAVRRAFSEHEARMASLARAQPIKLSGI
jgi:DNA-binding NtrC family response regulator